MTTPEEIRQKAERLYVPFLRAFLQETSFFPVEIPFAKFAPTSDYVKIRESVAALWQGSKEHTGYGYVVESSLQNNRRYGPQTLPSRIVIPAESDFVRLIGKEAEVAAFKEAAARIRAAEPELEDWMEQNPLKVIAYAGEWDALLRVCRYFIEHPRPHLYLRELPIPVHTKFIEEHQGILRTLLDILLPAEAIQSTESGFEKRYFLRYDEPLIRLRLLDDTLRRKHGFPVSDLSVPISQFATLPLAGSRCVITENKMNFLTLPAIPDGFALFGGGFRIELLRDIEMLHACPIRYWGDLDAHGFLILAQLRSYFPQTVSVLMDQETFLALRAFAVSGPPCSVERLPSLTPEEQALFAHLSQERIRLEQERIPQDFAVPRLRAAFHSPLC